MNRSIVEKLITRKPNKDGILDVSQAEMDEYARALEDTDILLNFNFLPLLQIMSKKPEIYKFRGVEMRVK